MARADDSVAIFREPGLPVKGAASDPERLGKLLADAGLKVSFLSAADLADSKQLRAANFATIVLPYGQSFPGEARRTMTAYLRNGGSFISTGGYTFNNLVLNEGGKWLDEKTVNEQRLAAQRPMAVPQECRKAATPTQLAARPAAVVRRKVVARREAQVPAEMVARRQVAARR